MAILFGINFRNSSGYVTDGANEFFGDGSTSQTINGYSCGWNTDQTGNDRDRTTSSPSAPRAAGTVLLANDGGTYTFTITGLAAADYKIGLMIGDAAYTMAAGQVVLKDNTTTRYTLNSSATTATTKSRDINDGEHTHSFDFDS